MHGNHGNSAKLTPTERSIIQSIDWVIWALIAISALVMAFH